MGTYPKNFRYRLYIVCCLFIYPFFFPSTDNMFHPPRLRKCDNRSGRRDTEQLEPIYVTHQPCLYHRLSQVNLKKPLGTTYYKLIVFQYQC
jgi:hypothetical protein